MVGSPRDSDISCDLNEEIMAYCSRCGEEHNSSPRFCPSCGVAVSVADTNMAPSPIVVPPPVIPTSAGEVKHSHSHILVIVGVLVLGVFAFVINDDLKERSGKQAGARATSDNLNFGYGPEGSDHCYAAGGAYAAAYLANIKMAADVGLMSSTVRDAGCAKHPPSKCVDMCKLGFHDELRQELKQH
jgi:hypothetical protein